MILYGGGGGENPHGEGDNNEMGKKKMGPAVGGLDKGLRVDSVGQNG